MAIELAAGYVSVAPNAEGFGKKLRDQTDDAGRQAGESAGDEFSGAFGGSLKKLAAVAAAAFATLKVGEFLKGSIDAASDLSESVSKVNVVFGDSAGEIQDWAKTSAAAMGQSRQQALEAAGTFGNLFTAMKIGAPQAATMSKKMVELAGDLASFNNVSPEEALDALRSGLTGETEPLKRFGVNMNEATLKAKAMELGLSDGKGVLDANAKAQAAYALILEQTGTAQGDFARTSSGLANQQRILAAQWTNLKATIGNAFLPLLVNSGHVLTTTIMPALQRFAELAGPVATKALQDFKNALTGVSVADSFFGRLGETIYNVSGIVANFVSGAWRELVQGFKGIDNAVMGNAIGQFFWDLGRAVGSFIETMRTGLTENDVATPLERIALAIRGVPDEIARFFATLKTGLTENDIATPLETIALKLRDISDWFKDHKDILTVFAASATAGAGGLLAYAGAASGIGTALSAIKTAQSTLSSAGGLASLLGPLGEVAAAAGPWGILAAAIAAVIAGVVTLYFKWQPFHDFVNTAAATIRDSAVTAFNALAVALTYVEDAFGAVFTTVQSTVSTAVAAILTFLQPLIDWFTQHLIPALSAVAVFLYTFWAENMALFLNAVQIIIGIVEPFLQSLYQDFLVAFELIKGAVEQAVNQVVTVIKVALDVLVPIWQTGWAVLQTVVETATGLIVNVITTALDVIRGVFSAATALIRGDWSGFWDAIKSTAESLLNGAKAAIETALNGIRDAFSNILGGIPGIISGIASGVSDAVWGIVGALDAAVGTIEGLVRRIKDAISSIPGAGVVGSVLSHIPGLAAGGLVTRPTLAVVGEAGPEAVIPLSMFNQGVQFGRYPTLSDASIPAASSGGWGSPTINIYAPAGAVPPETVEAIYNELRRYESARVGTRGTW